MDCSMQPEPRALPPAGWKQQRGLILASASARRRELLKSMGLEFRVAPSGIDEGLARAENACGLTIKLAQMKAGAVAVRAEGAFVIGSDSLVEFRGRQIGKPKTTSEAKEMLRSFSNSPQDVYTGVCVIDSGTGKSLAESVHSVVEFNALSRQQIEKWLSEGEVLELAGGYYIYEIIKRGFVRRILHTAADNVAGLPRLKLKEMLSGIGFYDG